MKEEKQQIADIDRSVYDIKDQEDDFYKIDAGLTPALVEQISKEKNDPEWMKEFRLHSLEIYKCRTGDHPSKACTWIRLSPMCVRTPR